MKILVLNCGSSSLKYKVFDGKEVIAQGGVEKIGLPDSFLKLTDNEGHKVIVEHFMLEHTAAVEFVFSEHLLNPKYGVLRDLGRIVWVTATSATGVGLLVNAAIVLL